MGTGSSGWDGTCKLVGAVRRGWVTLQGVVWRETGPLGSTPALGGEWH